MKDDKIRQIVNEELDKFFCCEKCKHNTVILCYECYEEHVKDKGERGAGRVLRA